MNLVDSSGWLEYLADGHNARFFVQAIEDTENLIVSTINLYEIFKRILQQRNEDAALQAAALMQQATVIDVTSSMSMSAAKLSTVVPHSKPNCLSHSRVSESVTPCRLPRGSLGPRLRNSRLSTTAQNSSDLIA